MGAGRGGFMHPLAMRRAARPGATGSELRTSGGCSPAACMSQRLEEGRGRQRGAGCGHVVRGAMR